MFSEDGNGHTALHLAVIAAMDPAERHCKVLSMLVTAGGLELLQKTALGRTALDYAEDMAHTSARDVLKHATAELERDMSVQLDLSVPVNAQEYRVLVANIQRGLLPTPEAKTLVTSTHKFISEHDDFVCGEYEHAAKGIYELLHADEDMVHRKALLGLGTIEEEVRALGDAVISEQLDYILHHEATEKMCPNGMRDQGHAGMRLEDFVRERIIFITHRKNNEPS